VRGAGVLCLGQVDGLDDAISAFLGRDTLALAEALPAVRFELIWTVRQEEKQGMGSTARSVIAGW